MVVFLQKVIFYFLVLVVSADVFLFRPLQNDTFQAKDGYATVDLCWSENNDVPLLGDIKSFTVALATGPIEHVTHISTIKENFKLESIDMFQDDGTNAWRLRAKIPANTTCDGNYFFQVTSILPGSNNYTLHYSSRFVLKGMNTTENSKIYHGPMSNAPLDDTLLTRPTPIPHVSEYYTIPYGEQTGVGRFAPMIAYVGNTTTTAKWSNHFKLTSLLIFTKVGQTYPNVQYTVTEVATYAYVTRSNTITGAPAPTLSYDALSRISLTPNKRSSSISLTTIYSA